MMFNGLIMCGDSDNSDFTKEYHRTSSVAESGAASGAGSGQCSAVTRAVHYHEKLMATLQILENKDEMIRIQADSLRLAESRISELTARAEDLRQKLQEKSNELTLLQATAEYEKNHKCNASVFTDLQEHQGVVRTLEGNLSVIEELYRECFYEAAKQEKLIEMLRSDIEDVRQMDRQKDTQIQRLQSVVHTQQWSLERCQDIAVEVDSLKMEISNFLTSSNNDSGMWERDSSASQADAAEDLREISAQLLLLKDLLTADCTCGLEKENKTLKQANAEMQQRITELEQELSERESRLTEKTRVEQLLKEDLDMKETELSSVREQLASEKRTSKDHNENCECLARKLKQTEVLLGDKCAELSSVQRLYAQEQSLVQELKMELRRAANLSEENTALRDEMQSLRAQVGTWRAQLADSERAARDLRAQLQRAHDLCQRQHRFEQHQPCEALQQSLDEARSRGAALLEDTRLVLLTVRRWTRAIRHTRREQEEKIKELEEVIESLQQQLTEKINAQSLDGLSDKSSDQSLDALNKKSHGRSANALNKKSNDQRLNALNEKSKGQSLNALNEKSNGQSLSALNEKSNDEIFNTCCSKRPRPKSHKCFVTDPIRLVSVSHSCMSAKERESTTETASASSAPVPPQKLAKKKSSHDRLCLCKSQRDTAAPRTSTDSKSSTNIKSNTNTKSKSKTNTKSSVYMHEDAAQCACAAPDAGRDRDVRVVTVTADPFRRRGLSPTSEMEAEIYEALSRGQRRWTRNRSASHTR